MTQPRVHTVGRASRSGHDLIVSASLSVQVADPCSQIKTGDVAIHSELLLHCIPSCIRDQCNTSVGCCLLCPQRPNMCALYVWCASVAKAALHHNTLRVSSVCSPSDVCQGVRLDHRKLDHAAPYQTPLRSCRCLTVQDICFAVRLFRTASNMELWLHGLGAQHWMVYRASAVGYFKPK